MGVLALHVFGDHGGDFKVYRAASTFLWEGKNPYETLRSTNEFGVSLAGYIYSPLFAILLIPLNFLPFQLSLAIWYVFNLVLLVSIFKLLIVHLGLQIRDKNQAFTLAILSGLFLVRFLDQNFGLGQITLVLIWASLYGVHLIRKGKTWQGALLLGLITTVKIIPGLVVFYLLIKGQFKAVLFVALASLVCLALPALWVGWEQNMFLHQEWFKDINPLDKYYAFETKSGLFNLSAFIPALFSQIDSESTIIANRNILSLPEQWVKIIINIGRLALVVPILFFPKWFGKGLNLKSLIWELSYVLMVTPLIFPRQSKYAFLYLLPAVLLVLLSLLENLESDKPKRKRKAKKMLIAMFFVFVCFNLTSMNIVGRQLHDVFQNYKVITYGCFILLGALFWVRPRIMAKPKLK